MESKTGIIIGAIVVLAVLIGGGLYIANMSNDDTVSNTTSTQEDASTEETMEEERQTIVDAAAANENFSTLVTAVQAAGLAGTLSGETEYTVFAPTNAAFEKLPAGTVDSLLMPENKEQLTGILTYHVVEGAVMSDQLSDGQVITTVNGAELTVSINDGMVYLVDTQGGRSTVTQADMNVDNGVIHAIDTVLMP